MESLLYILAFLTITILVLCLTAITGALVYSVIYMVRQARGNDSWIPAGFMPFKGKKEIPQDGRNAYTPMDNVSEKIPIDQFTPDFSKPIKFKIEDDEDGSSLEEKPYEV